MKKNVRFWYLFAAMLSQCIMKIPGVFVNIASGAIQRPDGKLTEETARTFVVCLHMPGPRQSIKCRHRWAELAWLNAALPDALWNSLLNLFTKIKFVRFKPRPLTMFCRLKCKFLGALEHRHSKQSIKCRHRCAELVWFNNALPDTLWNGLFNFVHKKYLIYS